jgi:hypothetical protein
VDTSTTAGDDNQQKRVADDEGSDEEGGEGDGNGDKGGERVTAMMVKMRVRAASSARSTLATTERLRRKWQHRPFVLSCCNTLSSFYLSRDLGGVIYKINSDY